MLMDVHQRGNLRFPQSLPEFQRLFPDDAACAGYLEKARWSDGFVCPHCQAAGEPFRFANRPGVLRCRKCRRDTGLTVGTVMARSHTPLSVWFWSAYLVSSQTPGMSAVQLRAVLSVQRLPFPARHRGRRHRTDLRRALLRSLATPYMLGVWVITG